MINKNDLISIIVKPTNACNLRCKHCYHAGTGYDNEQMSDKMLEKLNFFKRAAFFRYTLYLAWWWTFKYASDIL